VAGGLAWLREPLSGVLGEGGASPDAPSPQRPSLERFDLAKRECTELRAELDGFAVSGDGKWAVVEDRGDVRVIPADPKAGGDGSESVSVDLTRARFREDPAQLWRCAYDEAGRIIRRDFWVPDMSGVDWDGVLREYRPCWTGSVPPRSSPTCSGKCSANWAPRTPMCSRRGPARGRFPAGSWASSVPT
jgi:tricorn protease